MEIKTHLAAKSNYGAKRKTSDIKYIALHYTANDGDSDEGNANYFANPRNPKSSAHYFVDDDSVTQSVPDNCIAYSVGGSKYTECSKTGGGKLYGRATNANTLNIEMCDTVKDGIVKAQPKTVANTIKLVRELMDQYGIDIDHVIRHFDVNGKHCPAYLMDKQEWETFKARILGYEIGISYKTTKPCYLRLSPGGKKLKYKDAPEHIKAKSTKKRDNISFNTGAAFKLVEVVEKNGNIWGRMKSGYWVSLKYRGKIRAVKK